MQRCLPLLRLTCLPACCLILLAPLCHPQSEAEVVAVVREAQMSTRNMDVDNIDEMADDILAEEEADDLLEGGWMVGGSVRLWLAGCGCRVVDGGWICQAGWLPGGCMFVSVLPCRWLLDGRLFVACLWQKSPRAHTGTVRTVAGGWVHAAAAACCSD